MSDLLPSERTQLKEQIKQEKARADEQYACALRVATRVINESKEISEEARDNLLKEIWK